MADTSQRRRFLQCPRCGAENLPLNKFCGQCGANLRGETQGALMSAPLPPKAGTVLPYSPGVQGPGRAAVLAVIALILTTLFCAAILYLFLASGADRTPAQATSTPVALVLTLAPLQQ